MLNVVLDVVTSTPSKATDAKKTIKTDGAENLLPEQSFDETSFQYPTHDMNQTTNSVKKELVSGHLNMAGDFTQFSPILTPNEPSQTRMDPPSFLEDNNSANPAALSESDIDNNNKPLPKLNLFETPPDDVTQRKDIAKVKEKEDNKVGKPEPTVQTMPRKGSYAGTYNYLFTEKSRV